MIERRITPIFWNTKISIMYNLFGVVYSTYKLLRTITCYQRFKRVKMIDVPTLKGGKSEENL